MLKIDSLYHLSVYIKLSQIKEDTCSTITFPNIKEDNLTAGSLTLCEELHAALAGGRVDVVLEAVALCLPAGGVVGEVLPLLARARGLLHTPTLVSHHQGCVVW